MIVARTRDVTDLPDEIWVNIADYEGRYMVSNLGRIKGCRRMVRGRVQAETILYQPIRIAHPKWGLFYFTVFLHKNNIKKQLSVHRLVASAFLPNALNKPCVNHINSDGLDNRLANLEWVTYSENILHCIKAGRRSGKPQKTDRAKIPHGTPLATLQADLDRQIYAIETQMGL